MIYITEQNLRDLYGKQAFESFTLVEGERLTPVPGSFWRTVRFPSWIRRT